jgi:hypothetical protein
MTPNPGQITPASTVAPASPPPASGGWFQRVASILFIVFCLELGLFLLIYPWTDSWSGNYFSWIGPLRYQPVWHQIWNNGYVRGGVSGLGLLNIWVAVAEALRKYIGNDRNE